VRIEAIAADEIDRLRPLWLALHAHHQQVAPELAPYVDDERSWSVRRELYEEVLSQRGFALVASEDGEDLGYLVGAFEPALWPAMFAGAPDVAELETILLRPEWRGRGVGSLLFDEFEKRIAAAGYIDAVIGVLPGNDRAEALYRSRGFEPTVVLLTRFQRPPELRSVSGVDDVPASEVGTLRDLWLELHEHHRRIAAGPVPFASDDASWDAQRPKCVRAAEEGVLLRIGPAGAPRAMASALIDRDNPLWNDTWVTGRDVADIDVLSVTAAARGQGLGSLLLDAVDERLAALGVLDQVIGTLASNSDAARLYERRGFRPAWRWLTRFGEATG
jgi:ribosomal protein S18 acetylase RimI-like enzyme